MSGTMQYRVNRVWDSTIQPNVSPARFLWEWLNFINDHPGLTVVECGTGTTSHGSSIPVEWLSWDGVADPSTLSPTPFLPNSWVVFRAVNADALLDGGGGMPWEAKVQGTWGGTNYDDPSVTDYGQDGNADRVVLRSSPAGGWTGASVFDFSPNTGEAVSQDMAIYSGADKDFWLDLVGDDDTLFWKGAAGDWPTDDPKARSRGGYLGMFQRRSPAIKWPFWMTAGQILDATAGGSYPVNSKRTTNGYYVWAPNYSWNWPSFSLGRDDTAVQGHRCDTWSYVVINAMNPCIYTGEDVLPAILIRENATPDYYDVLGELRFLVTVKNAYGQNTVLGSNGDLIQICVDHASYGGIAMPWPSGVIPSW